MTSKADDSTSAVVTQDESPMNDKEEVGQAPAQESFPATTSNDSMAVPPNNCGGDAHAVAVGIAVAVAPTPGAQRVVGRDTNSLSQGALSSHPVADVNVSTEFSTDATLPVDAFLYDQEDEGLNAECQQVYEEATTVQIDIESSHDGGDTRSRKSSSMADVSANKKKLMTSSVIALVALVVGLIVVPLVLTSQGEPSNGDDTHFNYSHTAPPGPATAGYYPPFQEGLPAAIAKAIEEGPSTPESKANAWMWNDPNLTSYSPERQRQRFGMVTMYFSTQGENWLRNDHWLEYNISECEWASKSLSEEPICDDDGKTLILDLHSNNLNGTLPNAFWFTRPKYLDISHNALGGVVPTVPANSTLLEVFKVNHNHFIGQMTAEAGINIGNVRYVAMNSNQFGGAYFGLYPLIPKLEFLNLSDNFFTGPLSPDLQYVPNLKYCGCADNLLSGTMPTEIGLIKALESMDISGNLEMEGTIPSQLGRLSNLMQLDITGTGYTGSFPETLCEKTREGILSIAANCSSLSCCA